MGQPSPRNLQATYLLLRRIQADLTAQPPLAKGGIPLAEQDQKPGDGGQLDPYAELEAAFDDFARQRRDVPNG